MGHGPGAIERRIAELFVKTCDRALSVEDIAGHAFTLERRPAIRAQRLSATRAAHRLLRRIAEAQDKVETAFRAAMAETEQALGRPSGNRESVYFSIGESWIWVDEKFADAMRLSPSWPNFEDARRAGARTVLRGPWRETQTADRRLWFHPRDYPVRIWAVSVQPAGVIWADAEIVKITERNVMVRYAGDVARLDRDRLARSRYGAPWRGLWFTSSRTGRTARAYDDLWWQRYGKTASADLPPVMLFPLADAMALLGVAVDYTYDDVIAAFRREVKKAHPDMGGTAEQFRKLVEARDRLLATLGTTAPAPKMPDYPYEKGVQIVYRIAPRRSALPHLPSGRRLLSG